MSDIIQTNLKKAWLKFQVFNLEYLKVNLTRLFIFCVIKIRVACLRCGAVYDCCLFLVVLLGVNKCILKI